MLIQLQRLIVNGCFPAGSLVSTGTGVRPIETMQIGDAALSRDGTVQRVMRVLAMKSERGLVHLKVRGLCEPLSATPQHWVLGN